MGKIRILSDDVASQVAAGEVVERPASIVKELVENSLDAGASRIEVEFSRGGMEYLRVSDDGCGMDRDDALLCLERHATSKIRSSADLFHVRSMGFRGEAVPSIASVSRFRLTTREPDNPAGTQITVNGGKLEDVSEAGCPPGTTVEVRSLFFNVPARRKFLRGEQTEAAHITQTLHSLALANPAVAFEVLRDKRPLLHLPSTRDLSVRIRDLLGAEFLGRLIVIDDLAVDGIRISGLLARPGEGRRDRLQQFVFLNGRPVSCPAVYQALREAYGESLPRGSQPLAVLHISMDLALVDCNVHPAKREVRLSHPEKLSQAVVEASRAAQEKARGGWARRIEHPAPPPVPAPYVPASRQPALESRPALAIPQPAPRPATPLPAPAPVESDRFRVLGFLGSDYLALEGEDGLVLLDIQAAGERILFESLIRQMESGEVETQHLLIPEVVELPVREHAWVGEHLADLRSAGIHVEPFGGAAVKVEALPPFANGRPAGEFLHEIASTLRAAGRMPAGKGAREALARSVCQIAAAEKLPRDEDRARRLVRQLLACELPYASPAGRPTLIQFSFAELARKFGRS